MSEMICEKCKKDIWEECTCLATEISSEEGAICPYCKFIDSKSRLIIYDEGDYLHSCINCKEDYKVSVEMKKTWITEKMFFQNK